MIKVVDEREIVEPVALCDEDGFLRPEAIGWSRYPYHQCNIRGYWLRKKRWNFWFITSANCVVSIAVVHLDYVGLAFVNFVDLATGENKVCTVKVPFGRGMSIGNSLKEDVVFKHSALSLSFIQKGVDTETLIQGEGRFSSGEVFSISMTIQSAGESLNVVIPWSRQRFQFTSKQNVRPTLGSMKIGEKVYSFEPMTALASLDFGRGVWPYHTMWNWTTCSARRGEDVIGFNFGSGWTEGTGMTENGFVVNGMLYKLTGQVRFIYDKKELMKPWQVETTHSDQVRLTFTPQYHQKKHENFGIVRSTLHQIIGKYNGFLQTEDGTTILVVDQIGICEEQAARW